MIRDAINDERARRGLSPRALAIEADTTPSIVSRYLSGTKELRSDTLEKLFEALELEVRPKEES